MLLTAKSFNLTDIFRARHGKTVRSGDKIRQWHSIGILNDKPGGLDIPLSKWN
jgi:hypothetical protein